MKIYEKETHEAKYLVIEYEEKGSLLDDRLIDSLESRCLLKPYDRDPEGMITRYDISQYETLESYLVNRKMSRTEIVGLLAQLKSVIGVLEDHMLSDANVLLHPAYILTETLSRKVRFIPVQAQEGEFTERLRPLIELIFLHADINHVETLYLASEMMKVLLKGNVHLHELMQLIDHPYGAQATAEGWEKPDFYETAPAAEECMRLPNDQVTVLLSSEETQQEQPDTHPVAMEAPATDESTEKKGIRGLLTGLGDKVKELMEKDD